MSLNYAPQTVSAAEYERIFALERANVYPMVDAFEQRMGYAVDREKLEAAARVLSCPFKASPPNWQHGRVIYAAWRKYLETSNVPVACLDIGTAKGFSALCARWALMDSGRLGLVASVDVMPLTSRVRRNTIAEVDGLLTLPEILEPWPESRDIAFRHMTGIDWLRERQRRVNLAFVDGKHQGEVVSIEGQLLADRQESGDLVIFDDVQIPGVMKAVRQLTAYDCEYLEVKPGRKYAIAVRR